MRVSEDQPAARPLVVAHRGASEEFPEHTLPAYRAAARDRADGLECDVRLTADHHLVCVHDRRVDRTSDGSGVVSALELARLEGLDWASWKVGLDDSEVPEADPERGHLLTLRRLLDTVLGTGGDPLVLIETKHPTRHGRDVEKALIQVLRSFDLAGGDRPGRPRVRVMSFSRRALRTVHELDPRIPLVLLVESGVPSFTVDGSLPRASAPSGWTSAWCDASPSWFAVSSGAGTSCTSSPSTRTPTSTSAPSGASTSSSRTGRVTWSTASSGSARFGG